MSALIRTSALSLALVGAFGASVAQAGTSTDTFVVSVDMQNACTVVVGDMNFGVRTDLNANNITQTSQVSVNCSSIGGVSVAFDAGGVAGSTITDRLMKHTGSNDTIAYNLYLNNAHTDLLGDGTPGNGATMSIDPTTGGGVADQRTIYGKIAQTATAKRTGLYNSTVTATVTF